MQMLCPSGKGKQNPVLPTLLGVKYLHSHIQTRGSRLCNTGTKQTVAGIGHGCDIDAESFVEG